MSNLPIFADFFSNASSAIAAWPTWVMGLVMGLGGGFVSVVVSLLSFLAARKMFFPVVNVSVNLLDHGRLEMRTLLEAPARRVWLNPLYVARIRLAAFFGARKNDPILRVRRRRTMDFLKQAALNVVSPLAAEAFIAQALGQPVVVKPFLYALTYEKYDDQRTSKLRIMLIEKETLLQGVPSLLQQSDVQRHDRLRTLVRMYEYFHDPQRQKFLGELSLGVRY